VEWNELDEMMRNFLADRSDDPLIILSPFITTAYFEELMQDQREVYVVTSWRKDHLASGVSNINLYQAVKRNRNWKLFINDRLHAKVYCRNYETLIMGSANLTYSGLKDQEKSNHEVLVCLDCDPVSSRKIREIIRTSIEMNDECYQTYAEWFTSLDTTQSSVDTGSVIEPESVDELFLISQLPASLSPHRLWRLITENVRSDEDWFELHAANHDIETYLINPYDFNSYDDFSIVLKGIMLKHGFFNAFLDMIDSEGLRFGSAKQWIQQNCIDDPVPYRKELTRTVQNIFSWIVQLFEDEYEVIQPNHSQIIRKKR